MIRLSCDGCGKDCFGEHLDRLTFQSSNRMPKTFKLCWDCSSRVAVKAFEEIEAIKDESFVNGLRNVFREMSSGRVATTKGTSD